MFGFESMLNTDEMIKNLKLASSKCVGGYYFIMIRPALRDRIVELLEEKEKKEKERSTEHEWIDNGNDTVSCPECKTWFHKENAEYMRYCGYCGAKMSPLNPYWRR